MTNETAACVSVEVQRFHENFLVLEPSPLVCRVMAGRCDQLGDTEAAALWRAAANGWEEAGNA